MKLTNMFDMKPGLPQTQARKLKRLARVASKRAEERNAAERDSFVSSLAARYQTRNARVETIKAAIPVTPVVRLQAEWKQDVSAFRNACRLERKVERETELKGRY